LDATQVDDGKAVMTSREDAMLPQWKIGSEKWVMASASTLFSVVHDNDSTEMKVLIPERQRKANCSITSMSDDHLTQRPQRNPQLLAE
jgi:hypothetical protein